MARLTKEYLNLIEGSGVSGNVQGSKKSVSSTIEGGTNVPQENQTAVVYDIISEGPIEGLVDGTNSIFLDKTPVTIGDTKHQPIKIKNATFTASNSTLVDSDSSNPFSNLSIADGKRFIRIPKGKKSITGNGSSTGISGSEGSTIITASSSFFEAQDVTDINPLTGTDTPIDTDTPKPFIRIEGAGTNSNVPMVAPIIRFISATSVEIGHPLPRDISYKTASIDKIGTISSFTDANTAVIADLGAVGTAKINASNVEVEVFTPSIGRENTVYNYQGFQYAFMHGQRNQPYLKGFKDIGSAAIIENKNQAVEQTRDLFSSNNNTTIGAWNTTVSDATAQPVIVTDNAVANPEEVDNVKLTFKFPQMIASKSSSGDEKPGNCELRIWLGFKKTGDSAFTEKLMFGPTQDELDDRDTNKKTRPWESPHNSGKIRTLTKAPFAESFVIDLTPFKPFSEYQIKIQRVDPSQGRHRDYDHTSPCTLDTVEHRFTDKLAYPNSAFATMLFDAESFAKIPSRSYEVKGLKVKVPTNYFPRGEEGRAYGEYDRNPSSGADSGSYQNWDGNFRGDISTFAKGHVNHELVWTDNPAWVFYDLVTNKRYGVGKYIDEAQIDKFELYKIARYCDELVADGKGGTEPRFTANVYIKESADALKVLKDITQIFRGMLYWLDGQIQFSQNRYQLPVYTFSKGNVTGGFSYTSPRGEFRSNQIRVTWNDPESMYKQAVEIVEDTNNILETGKVVPKDVVAFGATSRGQAHRFGKWSLFTEILESEAVAFQSSINAGFLKPGDVILIQDADRDVISNSGRISNFNPESGLTLDETIGDGSGFQANTYSVAERSDDAVFAAEVTLPSSFSQDATLWEMGGTTVGAYLGVRDVSGVDKLTLSCGSSETTEHTTGTDRIVTEIPISDIPEFDDQVHTICWELQPNPGKQRLWIDGKLYIDEQTTGGGALQDSDWGGSNPGAWLGANSSIPRGLTSNAWPVTTGASGLRNYYGETVSASDYGNSTTKVNLDRNVNLSSGNTFKLSVMYPQGGAYLSNISATINDDTENASTTNNYERGDLVTHANVNGTVVKITTDAQARNAVDSSGNPLDLEWNENSRVETQTISTTGASVSALTVSSAFTSVPSADFMWAIREYDAAGDIVNGSAQQYVISEIKEDTNKLYTISALKYDSSKFDLVDRGYILDVGVDTNKLPSFTETPPAPETLTLDVLKSFGSGLNDESNVSGTTNKIRINWGRVLNSDGTQYQHLSHFEIKHNINSLKGNKFKKLTAPKDENYLSVEFDGPKTIIVQIQSVNINGGKSQIVQRKLEVTNDQIINSGTQILKIPNDGKINKHIQCSTSTVSIDSKNYQLQSSDGTIYTNPSNGNTASYQQDFAGMANNSEAYLLFDASESATSGDILKAVEIKKDSTAQIPTGTNTSIPLDFEYMAEVAASNSGITQLTANSQTISGSIGDNIITGSSTAFTTDFVNGDTIVIAPAGATRFYSKISYIENDGKLQIVDGLPRDYSSVTVSKLSFKPDPISDVILAKVSYDGSTYALEEKYSEGTESLGYFHHENTSNTNALSADAFKTQFGRFPQEGDILIVVNTAATPTASKSYKFSDNTFSEIANFMTGDLLVDGTIEGDKIRSDTQIIAGADDSNKQAVLDGTGTGDNALRIYAGANVANKANAPFKVTQGGALTATNATITGNITASTGDIGGWTVDANSIFSGTKDVTDYTTTGITISSANNGSIHAKEFYIDTSGNANFKGTIFGGSIRADVTNPIPTTIFTRAAPDTNIPVNNENGAFIDLESGKFVFGKADNYLSFDGTTTEVSGTVSANTLLVTDATIVGELTATKLASGTVKVDSLAQEVWNAIGTRTGQTGGYYDSVDTETLGQTGYLGEQEYIKSLNDGGSGYEHEGEDTFLELIMNDAFFAPAGFTGTAIQATAQFQFKLNSASTWTNVGSAMTLTLTSTSGQSAQHYSINFANEIEISSSLTSGNYYDYRVKIVAATGSGVRNAFQQFINYGQGGANDANGSPIIFEIREGATGVTTGDLVTNRYITHSGDENTRISFTPDQIDFEVGGENFITLEEDISDIIRLRKDVIMSGDLTVEGTTTTLNTATLDVEDKNITLNYGSGDTSGSANGAGITIQDAVDVNNNATILWDATNDEFDFSHGITLPDSKSIKLGDNSDLQIYHDGSHSYIADSGTGNLRITGNAVQIRASTVALQDNSAYNYLRTEDLGNGGIVKLYHGSVSSGTTEVFRTASTGVNVTGNISVTGTVDGIDIATRDHDAVTLAGTPDYITISGQTITRNQIDLTSDVTGVLPSAKLDADTAHLSGTQTFTGTKTFTSPVINTGISGTAVLDDDTFGTASATTIATSESIKAYVDSQPGTITSISNFADNRILTASGSTTINGEANLTFNGSALSVVGDISLGDNKNIYIGTANELQLVHNGNDSIIKHSISTGELKLGSSGTGITFYNPSNGDIFAEFNAGADVTLYHNDQPKLATTSTGIDVTGTVTSDGLTVDGTATISASSATLNINGSNTGASLINFGDSDDGNVGRIYYDHASNFMQFKAADGERLRINSTGIDVTGTVTSDGLTVDGNTTLNPTSNFVTIKGGTNDNDYSGIIIQSNWANTSNGKNAGQIQFQADDDDITGSTYTTFATINAETTDWTGDSNIGGHITIQTSEANSLKDRLRVGNNGDISFYEDTGTTAKLLWDASAEALRVGGTSAVNLGDTTGNGVQLISTGINIKRTCTTSTQGLLHLNNIGVDGNIIEFYSDGVQKGAIGVASDAGLTFVAGSGSSEKMRIDSSGNVGIGTDDPATLLEVSGSAPKLRITDERDQTFTVGDIMSSIEFDSDDTSGGAGTSTEPRAAINMYAASTFGSSTGLEFRTKGDTTSYPVQQMVITDIGRVGIGEDAPSAKLHVHQTGNGSTNTLILEDDARRLYLGRDQIKATDLGNNVQNLYIQPDGNTRFATNSGSVSVGSTTALASSKLYVRNGSSGQSYSNVSGVLIDVNGSSNSYYGLRVGSSTGDDHLAVTNAGRVGIGTSSPATKLHVFSSDTTQATFTRDLTTDVGLTIGNDNSGVVFGTIGVHNYQFYANGARRLNITSTGAVTFNEAFTFPTADGDANQVLQTDGSGNLSFADAGAITSITNFADNRVLTASGSTTINGESNLTWDGSELYVGGTTGVRALKLRATMTGTNEVVTHNTGLDVKINNPGSYTLRNRFYNSNSSSSLAETVHFGATGGANFLSHAFWTVGANDGTNTDGVYLDNQGRVGIGDSTPGQKLDVAGNINLGGDARHIYFGGSNTFIGENSNSTKLQLRGGGNTTTSTVFIDTGGAIGVGTSTPSGRLHSVGSGATQIIRVEATDGSQASFDLMNSEGHYRIITDGGQFRVYDQTDTRQPFTIDTSGHSLFNGNITINDSDLILNNNTFGTYDWKHSQDDGGKLIWTVSGTSGAEMELTSDGSAYGNAVLKVGGQEVTRNVKAQTLTNKTLTSPVLNTGVSGTAIKDEDNMASDSATHLATQQSIKAYVDSQTASAGTITGVTNFADNRILTASGSTTINGETNLSFSGSILNVNADADFNGANGDLQWDSSADSLIFNDNVKAIFGTGSDFEIYHDQDGPSYIRDRGSSDLVFTSNGSGFKFRNDNSTEILADLQLNGAVTLYYDNSPKLATTSTGVDVTGLLSATTKSFVIDHPTKEGMKLRYGSLEGPENGVYVRGRLNGNTIELPDYWTELVHEDSITVNLTPIGKHQKLYIEDIRDNQIIVGNENLLGKQINCFYTVYAERKDVERFEVEYGNSV